MTGTGDFLTALCCRAAAVAAVLGSVCFGITHQWLAVGLVLWLVPSLLLVGALAGRAHIEREGER